MTLSLLSLPLILLDTNSSNSFDGEPRHRRISDQNDGILTHRTATRADSQECGQECSAVEADPLQDGRGIAGAAYFVRG